MIDLDQLYEDGKKAGDIQDMFTLVSADIMQNKNLRSHLHDIEEAIKECDISISEANKSGIKPENLLGFRNDLFRLKYEILERLK